jgi:hypothetical protein
MKVVSVAALLILALAATAPRARAISAGAEVFGGMIAPIEQDDADQGSLFGVRLPVQLMTLLTAEGWYSKSTLGDKTATVAGLPYTRDGGTLTGYGLNARIGGMGAPGLSFFPYAGFGSYRLEREGSDDVSEIGYDFGFGMVLTPAPRIGISLRGQFDMVPTGSTSRKYGEVQVGVSYTLLSTP